MNAEPRRASGVRAYTAFIVSHRWIVVILTLLAVGAAGYGTTFLTINPDSRLFFGPKDPHRLALERLEDTYGKLNSAIIVMAPKDGKVFTRRTLSAIHDLTEKAWKTPYSSRVNSLTNYQYSYAEGDDVIVEDLVPDTDTLDEAAVQRIKQRAMGEDRLVNWLVSKDADVTAIVILVTQPGKSLDEVPQIVTHVRAMLAQARKDYPDIDFYLSGGVVADMAFEEAGDRDLSSVVPLMVLLIVVALGIGLRTILGTAGCVAVIVFSVATALGLAGWDGYVLNAATTGTPIMIMTLGVADCVHLVVSARHNLRDGLSQRDAVIEALSTNFIPICITSLTTAVGFTTLNFSESPPLRDMGNIVAVGMVAAFIYSVTFFPAILAMVPMRAPAAANPSGRLIGVAVAWVTARRNWCFAVSAIVLLTLAFGIGRLSFDDNFIRYFDKSYAFRRDTDFLQTRLSGLHVVQYSLPSGKDQGIADPEYLKKVDEFAKWFSKQPKVTNVKVLTDTMKRLNMAMHGDDPSYDRIADSRELNAQYLLFYEMSLPFGLDISTEVDIAHSSLLFTAFLAGVSSNEVREIGLRGEEWLKKNAPELAAPATGLSMVYAYISERNIRSMMLGTLVALVLISGIMLVVLRSVFIGLISLVPNVIPAAMALGVWGYLEGEVNLSVSVVGAMTLGIIVDDTVHILTRYIRARRDLKLAPAEAIRHTVERVGIAVTLTSVALILGFSMLATSGFAVSGQMGLISAITILVALVADLSLLPALLVALDRPQKR
jgi:predicted RND superfamily exporter protein